MVARLKKIFIIINNIWGCQSEIRYVLKFYVLLQMSMQTLCQSRTEYSQECIEQSHTKSSRLLIPWSPIQKIQPRKQPGPRKSQPFNHRQENDSLLFRLYFVFNDQLMQLWCIDPKKKMHKTTLKFLKELW